eukprot:Nk52_evm27s2531 gene=Nk52_evmTU27s2531
MSSIRVVARFRPQNEIEKENGGKEAVDFVPNDSASDAANSNHHTTVQVQPKGEKKPLTFSFDRVFNYCSSQTQVYDYVAKPIVQDILKGYNGTVFAYGQTSSGKTYTMEGPDIYDEEHRGIIPRIAFDLFDSLALAPDCVEFSIKVSYLEIYMERIRDLLDVTKQNLQIHEDKVQGIYVKGCTEVYVSSVEEVMDVMKEGQENRVVANTQMNAESSRSHSVFIVTVVQNNLEDQSVQSGKLYLVDLAGSEKVGKTGASGMTLEEAKKINKSLSALGMVINALTEGSKKHIPYRDSKLTRILQESLGGNSKTSIVVNCSPSTYNDKETVSSLRFGERAKSIKNKAVVNKILSAAELKKRCDKAEREIRRLKQLLGLAAEELRVWREGGSVEADKYVCFDGGAVSGRQSPSRNVGPSSGSPITNRNVLSSASDVNTTSSSTGGDDQQDAFLQRENELLDEIASKENSLTELQRQLELEKTKMELMEELKNDNKSLKASIAELTKMKERMAQNENDLRISVESLTNSNRSWGLKVEELQGIIAGQEKEKEDFIQAEKEKIEAKIASVMSENASAEAHLKDDLNEKAKKLRDLEAEMSVAQVQLKDTNEELTELKRNYDEQMEILKTTKSSAAKFEDENRILSSRKDELTSQLKTLESDNRNLHEKLSNFDSKLAAAESEGENLTSLKADLEEELLSYKNKQTEELVELHSKIRDMEAQLDDKEGEVTSINYQLKSLTAERDHLSHLLDKIKNSQNSSKTSSRLVEEKDKLIAELQADFQKQCDAYEHINSTLIQDLHNRCQKVIKLEVALDDARGQYEELLKKTQNTSATKMKDLENELKELSTAHDNILSQNSQLKTENDAFEKKIEARDERIVNMETSVEEAQLLVTRLTDSYEEKFKKLTDRIAELESQRRPSKPEPRIAKKLRGGQQKGVMRTSSGRHNSTERLSESSAHEEEFEKKETSNGKVVCENGESREDDGVASIKSEIKHKERRGSILKTGPIGDAAAPVYFEATESSEIEGIKSPSRAKLHAHPDLYFFPPKASSSPVASSKEGGGLGHRRNLSTNSDMTNTPWIGGGGGDEIFSGKRERSKSTEVPVSFMKGNAEAKPFAADKNGPLKEMKSVESLSESDN